MREGGRGREVVGGVEGGIGSGRVLWESKDHGGVSREVG